MSFNFYDFKSSKFLFIKMTSALLQLLILVSLPTSGRKFSNVFIRRKCLFHVTIHSSFCWTFLCKVKTKKKLFSCSILKHWDERRRMKRRKDEEIVFRAKNVFDDWWIKVRWRKLSYKVFLRSRRKTFLNSPKIRRNMVTNEKWLIMFKAL